MKTSVVMRAKENNMISTREKFVYVLAVNKIEFERKVKRNQRKHIKVFPFAGEREVSIKR